MKMKTTVIFLLNCFPSLKRGLKSVRDLLFPNAAVSAHYVSLKGAEADTEGQRLRAAWQDNALPQRQRELVEQQLLQYRNGARIDVFDVFADSVRALPELSQGMSLLEIGCSSGFYSEVIELAELPVKYAGCDYSDAFIRLAREKYPFINFSVEDATALRYSDKSFDVAVSGCCLLHIPEYTKAVEETARVAGRYAIFHRTPVVWGRPEQWYRKQAYGVETVEIHFNESEFLVLLAENELELIATYTLHEEKSDTDCAQGQAIRTYVCKKKDQ
ncbi:class I SAM-dependent methyltransferase [Rhodoferax saidenbachensis]|uniref:Ubiquinone/menaquinone biosynthesis C-methylase UbiE n=1 Tax=Rhodoferax saidenbachensis TaxID=1484693 RepID=A0ABU1ZM90_9BURK|nr:class I SAM-dependent methyltransferase [Rhodoferax saidenbachensis]MDR7306025.1 ubiquinone/menaquinone biosynthesis C-methylase UbiE [Rhodoferax saidenbachensis]